MGAIVMTGGTSGFGALAAEQLRGRRDAELLIGDRGRQGREVAGALPLDLARLDSVRSFARAVLDRLDGRPVDALVLNAGGIRADDRGRTVDGYETTFAVNHLAHYLMIRLLLPALADGGRVVLTTSGTHDPATKAGLATPRHADAELLAHPELDPGRDTSARRAGQHAYTAAKLCAVLTVRALAGDGRAGGGTAVAFDPGQVFGTGLARDLPRPMRAAWSVLGSPVGAPLRALKPELNTRAAAARALADLASGAVPVPPGRSYAALRRGRLGWPDPSELARSDDLARALWTDSARLVGLSDATP